MSFYLEFESFPLSFSSSRLLCWNTANNIINHRTCLSFISEAEGEEARPVSGTSQKVVMMLKLNVDGHYTLTRCLKITEKISFNILSEASYVYILSGQKLFQNAKNGPFWRVFENLKLAVKQCYQTGQF